MSTPRLLSNRYELGETLGYGGMSEVHGGRDVRLGRDVAIKVLRADLARDPQFQVRFRREAQNAAALNHPAIVAVYDTGEAPSSDVPLPYIVMEYVAGRTLRDIVKTDGPMDPYRVCEVLADVCAALDFSHRHGIIHRDVKPANLLLEATGDGRVPDLDDVAPDDHGLDALDRLFWRAGLRRPLAQLADPVPVDDRSHNAITEPLRAQPESTNRVK